MARPHQEVSIAEECVPNISARGRTRRLIGGSIWAVATGAICVFLARRHAPTLMFFVVSPFVAIAALYFFQVKEKTCVVLAPRGLREENDGTRTRIAGEWLVAVRRQARKVWIETMVTTAVVTAAAVAMAYWR
jgi:hypothetical protein